MVPSPIEARPDLARMLAELTPERREILIRRERDHLTYEQIAGAMNLPQGIVESSLRAAREELRKQLKVRRLRANS